jgi:hypothetical protein
MEASESSFCLPPSNSLVVVPSLAVPSIAYLYNNQQPTARDSAHERRGKGDAERGKTRWEDEATSAIGGSIGRCACMRSRVRRLRRWRSCRRSLAVCVGGRAEKGGERGRKGQRSASALLCTIRRFPAPSLHPCTPSARLECSPERGSPPPLLQQQKETHLNTPIQLQHALIQFLHRAQDPREHRYMAAREC